MNFKELETDVINNSSLTMGEWQDENNTVRLIHENHGEFYVAEIASVYTQVMLFALKMLNMLYKMDREEVVIAE